MKETLYNHLQKYPEMELRDAVKLIYQSVFGCAHLVSDKKTCIDRLEKELEASAGLPVRDAFEDIGGGYVRFYLNSEDGRAIAPELIAEMFMESSRYNAGTNERLEKEVAALKAIADEGKASFTADDIEKYMEQYRADGYPMVSHTAKYNATYHPAYRVMLKKFEGLAPLVRRISDVLKEKDRCVIAIDGRSASGKSTLSDFLNHTFGAAVVHMDDFFLPPELRTEERFAKPGGNVHYERFEEEVTPKLNDKKEFSYRIFDCSKMELDGEQTVEDKAIVVVEGAYSLNPEISAQYDITVFSDIDPADQKKRILVRNGPAMLKNFVDMWIPLENEYIEKCAVKERCDLIYKGGIVTESSI